MTIKPAAIYQRLVLTLAFLCLCGCATGPELRPSGGSATSSTKGEGRRFLEQGRAVEAVSAFRKRIRKEGADLQALNGLAIAYNELGKPDLAAEMFSRALAIAPDDPVTLNNIGFAALRRADKHLARRYLERARIGGSGFEKIEGNLAGLAWLENVDQKRRKASDIRPGGLPAKSRAPTQPLLISLPNGVAPTSSATNAPSDHARQPLPRTMIDFTAVVDPFSEERTAE